MKKLARCLLTLALSAPLLGGCSLFSTLPEETKDVLRLDLRDYTSSAALNSKYNFDGKVYIMYQDNTEKEITGFCDFRDVDTSKVGKSELRVDYETKSKIYYTVTNITVYDPNAKSELESISVSNYTDTVEKGVQYTFDGKVYAKYKGVDNPIQVKNSDCVIGSISTATTGSKSLTISFTDSYNDESGTSHSVTKKATVNITVVQKPTAISASALEIGVNRSKQIQLTFTPSDTTEKGVTYVSSNPQVASVDENGNVTGKTAGQSTTITVTSKVNSSVKTTVNVSVIDIQQDDWTIMLYVCGADLESGTDDYGQLLGLASEDISEILSVKGKPDGINILIQTGGANKWANSSIRSDKIQRWSVQKGSTKSTLQNEDTLSYVSMGSESTLESFVTWGLSEYPAEKVGLIMWNHGGAMTGCCFDEKKDDSLTPVELSDAVKAAKASTGYADKFEFIGYDCCLMQVQDIAGLNSEYAKYQIGSEESEWGYGWSYDSWIDDLYAGKSTENILKACVDGYRDATEEAYDQWGEPNDQTLSILDLSKWDAYQTAWESMATSLSSKVTSKTTFNSLFSKVTKYGATDDGYGNTVYPFDVFDAGDFLTKTKSKYSSDSSLVNLLTTCESKYADLVYYEWHGSGAGNSSGMTLFAPISGYSSTSDYPSLVTSLSNWRNICLSYGTWYL